MKNVLMFTVGLAWIVYPQRVTAEALDLGDVKPTIRVFDAILSPRTNLRLDIVSRSTGMRLKGDAFARADTQDVQTFLARIIDNKLPYQIKSQRCNLDVDRVDLSGLRVLSNTGVLQLTAHVGDTTCALPPGQISLDIRFVPKATPKSLGISIADVKSEIPRIWKVLGFMTGNDIRAAIKAGFIEMQSDLTLPVPEALGKSAAFQGASLDSEGTQMVLRIRGDMEIEQPRVASIFSSLDQVKSLSWSYP